MLLNIVCLANSYLYFETQSSFLILWRLLRLIPMSLQKDMPSFWIIFLFFGTSSWRLVYFLCPGPGISHFSKKLISFIQEWYLEINIWVPDVLIAPGVSLFLSLLNGHIYIIYTICTNSHVHTCSYLILCL